MVLQSLTFSELSNLLVNIQSRKGFIGETAIKALSCLAKRFRKRLDNVIVYKRKPRTGLLLSRAFVKSFFASVSCEWWDQALPGFPRMRCRGPSMNCESLTYTVRDTNRLHA